MEVTIGLKNGQTYSGIDLLTNAYSGNIIALKQTSGGVIGLHRKSILYIFGRKFTDKDQEDKFIREYLFSFMGRSDESS